MGLIEVNVDHPDFGNLGKLTDDRQARHLLMLDSIFLQHLQAELKAGRVDDPLEMVPRYHDLRARYLQERAKKKK